MPRKLTELSSREDFIVDQFPTMKKVNTVCSKLFDMYFIDSDIDNELSPMMRTMVPNYYIDPINPEHPSCYLIVGKSSVSYLERWVEVYPFVNSKGKYEYDLSGYKGLLFNPVAFQEKVKGFRKTMLEPLVVIGEQNGERVNQSVVLREKSSTAKQEHIIPFLLVPNRKKEGNEAYRNVVEKLVYEPFYRYLPKYLKQDLNFYPIPMSSILEILENDVVDFVTEDGDRLTVTKGMFPGMKADQHFYIAKPDALIDTSYGKFHYVIKQEFMNDHGSYYMIAYTLVAALQLK